MARTGPASQADATPRPPSRRWAGRVAPVVLAVACSGCTEVGGIRWPGAPKDPRGPQPAQPWQDTASTETSGRPRLLRPPPHGLEGRPSLAGADPNTGTPTPTSRTADGQVVRGAIERPADDLPPALPPEAESTPAPVPVPEPGPDAIVEQTLAPVVPPADRGEYPIDLTTALRLAEAENPEIAAARVRIGEALALREQAQAMLLPTFNAGFNYHGHVGNLQRSVGRILNLSEQALYFGGGSGAAAANTIAWPSQQVPDASNPASPLTPVSVPAINIYSHLADAIFQPLAARQVLDQARFNASATANRILLEVAELHFDLTAAEAELAYRRQTAEDAAKVARLTRAYAEAKQGRAADANRARTELLLIEREVRQAEENVRVTSVRLVRRLHLDPTVRVRPLSAALGPITIVDPDAPLPGLIEVATRQRPEVNATSAGVAAAEVRHRQEMYRPLLPVVFLGFSGGAFGGGSNLTPPTVGNFGGRTDFDIGLFWTLRNLGAGNVALIKQRWAEMGEAVGERSLAYTRVREEVSAAYAEVISSRRRIEITTAQLKSAEAGFGEDLERIENEVGRPVEVVNSLHLLNDARIDRVRAVNDFNKAEVRLYVALGSPPPLQRPATEPIPPAPLATPPVSPVPRRP